MTDTVKSMIVSLVVLAVRILCILVLGVILVPIYIMGIIVNTLMTLLANNTIKGFKEDFSAMMDNVIEDASAIWDWIGEGYDD